MALQRFYPVLMAEDVEASARFYAERMGFEKTFESDWYVSLRHRENPAYELAVLSPVHETIPDGFRGTPASGLNPRGTGEVSCRAAHRQRIGRSTSTAEPEHRNSTPPLHPSDDAPQPGSEYHRTRRS